MNHRLPSFLAAVALLSLPAAALAEPCAGLSLRGGKVTPAKPLSAKPGDAAALACARAIGVALKAHGGIRAVTVAVRLSDAERVSGAGARIGAAYEAAIAAGGVPAGRISTIVPAADGAPTVAISFTARRSKRSVAAIESMSGKTRAGRSSKKLAPVVVGQKLPVGMVVETGAGSCAWLALADGSRLRMTASTTLRLAALKLDDNLKRVIQIDLLAGNIETDAAPRGAGSTFQIRNRMGTAGVRGTHFRVAAVPNEQLRLETLHGLVELSNDKARVEVPTAHGSAVEPGRAPSAVRPLLPAAKVDGPLKGAVDADETLRWEDVSRAAAYRVELARDAEFSLALQAQTAKDARLALPRLAAGKWFWRVMAVDADGFVGLPSKVYAFVLPAL